MRTSGNTILITGGATGIGFALAGAFLKEGNEVLICGRREKKLAEAKRKLPELHVRQCDVADAKDRKKLLDWIVSDHKRMNVLINNAGIQRDVDFQMGAADLEGGEDEIEINLQAPVRLSALFIPHLKKQKESAIFTVSSGLGFVPIAVMPVYCATKAALHSFSLSLRHQLRNTSIKVFEIIPPMTDTELDRGARGRRAQVDRGIKPEIVAEAAVQSMGKNQFEIAVGEAQFLCDGSRKEPEKTFHMINAH
jgi:uncharacterized oxidoreductase